MPCIGQGISFELENAYLLHSNLGGKGPDTTAPPSIRFVNVASLVVAVALDGPLAGRTDIMRESGKWCYELRTSVPGGCSAYYTRGPRSGNIRLCESPSDGSLKCTAFDDPNLPPSVRDPSLNTLYIDLEVSARSEYMPYDSSLNQKLGKFAQINLAANHEVDLRVSMKRSCARKPSCEACKDPTLDAFAQVRCYANGCACYGTTVFAEGHCMGTEAANKRASYNCAELNQPLMLPREAVVTMTVYDFDRGTQRLCHRHPPFALLRSPLLLPPPHALPSRCLRRTLLLTRFGRARHEVH